MVEIRGEIACLIAAVERMRDEETRALAAIASAQKAYRDTVRGVVASPRVARRNVTVAPRATSNVIPSVTTALDSPPRIQFLSGLLECFLDVNVPGIEIQAEAPDGVDRSAVRAATQNCRVFKFKSHGFEHA